MKPVLVEFSSEFLDLSYGWLHDDEIKILTNTRSFSKEDQKIWFERIKEAKDYLIWGIEVDAVKIGACGVKHITNVDCEYWGYIGEKEYIGRGIGSRILMEMENEAKKLKVKSIWLKVVSDNKRAINLYNKRKFILESEKDNLLFMRKEL